MKELIKTYLADLIREIAPEFKSNILVKIPENKENGDYSTNIAFLLAKALKKSPQTIAEESVEKLRKQKISDFSKIESVGGFINFFLSADCLQHQVKEILKQKNKYGFSKTGQSQKVQVEFISANPTGPLTLGNGRGGFWGDVLANILASQGYKVQREYYINDRGEQVISLGRSIKYIQGQKYQPKQIDRNLYEIKEEIQYKPEDVTYKGEYIRELAEEIPNSLLNDSEVGDRAVKLVLERFVISVVEKKLKIKFDKWFSEKSLYKKDLYKKVFDALVQKNLVYEKEGATWMKTSKLGDTEDRVLIKKDGNETYFLSDILYHWDKFNNRKFDKVIDIWGADHHGYAPRLKGALQALDIDSEKLEILITQLIRLIRGGKEFKMSKRAGTYVTIEELVDMVGLDAVRFFFLSSSPNTHIDFDIDLAQERSEKNPVYYIQYAHARLASILRKVGKFAKPKVQNYNFNEKAELDLARKLIELPELLSEVVRNYEVHHLSRYALELARQVSAFYRDVPVLRASGKEKGARLGLVTATKIILENTLTLMGIKAPDKM